MLRFNSQNYHRAYLYAFPNETKDIPRYYRYQVRPCYPKMKRVMRRVVLCLVVCAILNVVTIVIIACFVNLKPNSLKDLFQASMRFYSRNASYKITIDELQLDFQCCGHSSFVDWFAFNWQVFFIL